MSCPHCSAENSPGARFCGRCGQPLERSCQACGERLDAGVAFCTACGAHVDAGAPRELSDERKVVSVLFADLVGSTSRAEQLDPEDVRAFLDDYYARFRSELERFGGTVEKFIGDAVMAVFGAPAAHEDDAERAVRAALAIRGAVRETSEDPHRGLRVRIGVTTGEVLVALSARSAEGEAIVAGDIVNVAARLQAHAPENGILVDEATYRRTRRLIEYREAEPVRAKGKTTPIPVWEAHEATTPPRRSFAARDAPLVGRRDELDLLHEAAERTRRERAPQLVTLVGDPGIGKSRLVLEFGAALDDRPQPAYWLQGRSPPYGERGTFRALSEIVKAYAQIVDTDTQESITKKLRTSVRATLQDAAEAEWVERHLRPLVGLAADSEARDESHREAFAAWRRFFQAIAEQEHLLVLVFEDLHWADEDLLHFVDDIVEWSTDVPLLVLVTTRPDLFERGAGWGGGKRNALTISLRPLTDDETAELLAALLERAVLRPSIEPVLVGRAGGNPLYAGEYVRMLSERRGVGTARDEPQAELPLPESVQSVIAARLDALDADEKSLLQDASVLGESFSMRALGELARWEPRAVERGLCALERKEYVRRGDTRSPADDPRYSFSHVLVRDVAYSQLVRARRAEKHRLAAEWLVRRAAESSEDHAALVAQHYVSCLELTRALGEDTQDLVPRVRVALVGAGDRAYALSGYVAAARFYGSALELTAADDEDRPPLLFWCGRALFHGELGGEVELTAARDALLVRGDPDLAAEAEVMLCSLVASRGERSAALARLENAAAMIEGSGTSRSKAYVLATSARFLFLAGRHADAIRVGRDALKMGETLDLDEVRAQALNYIGAARVLSGDMDGIADVEQSIAIAEQINSPEVVRGARFLASVWTLLGDLPRGFALFVDARRACERFGDAFNIGWLDGARPLEEYWSGRWDEAVRFADAFLAGLEAGAEHYMETLCRIARGQIRLARGDTAGACEDATACLAVARRAQHPWYFHPALGFAARVHAAAGDVEQGGACAEELLAAWSQHERSSLPFYWTVDLAHALTALGRADEFLAAAAQAHLRTSWLAAAEAFSVGEFERAAQLFAQIGSLPDEAVARARAAEALANEGRAREAGAELERALVFFRRVGASADVHRAERLSALIDA